MPVRTSLKVTYYIEELNSLMVVVEFDKRFKLAEGKGDKSAENPGKGILKKTVIAKSVIQTTTTNKNVNKANKKNNKKNNKKKVKF